MKPYEEELQKNIEQGKTGKADSVDEMAYQEVFRVLKKDPGYNLPYDFAARVITQVTASHKSSFSKDFIWFGLGILFLSISFIATVFYTGFKADFGFLNGMSDYKGLLFFGISFIILLNWLDKRLVKDRHLQH